MTHLLGVGRDFSDPALWAVVIGWVMSVTLHEFAHGVVAYWGGDYTIRSRGGLTLNPLQYVDPVMSILLPLVFLLMGACPCRAERPTSGVTCSAAARGTARSRRRGRR